MTSTIRPLRTVLLLAALAGLATAQMARAESLNRATVWTKSWVPTVDLKGLQTESSRSDASAGPVALGTNEAPLFGERDVVTGFDGRCVVIATGAPCQGGEDPLTTQTVLSASKPILAREGTSAAVDAGAFARDGRVGARARSTVSTGFSHATIDPANPGRSLPGRLHSTGSANTSAFASSTHTNTLLGPAGGVATVTLSGVMHGHLSIDGTPGLLNQASYALLVQGSAAPAGQRCNNLLIGCAAQFSFGHWADGGSGVPLVLGDDRQLFDISFQARVGDVVTLYLQANASTYNSGVADASHTLSLDSITLSDGFAFADESAFVRDGSRYVFAASVPEPAAVALWLAGLGLLAWRARAARTGPRPGSGVIGGR